MRIAILNKSGVVTTPDFKAMVAACRIQLKRHFCPAWDMKTIPVRTVENETQVLPGEDLIVLLDSADEADALGYHSETPDGLEYGRVFVKVVLDAGGTVLDGADSVSSVLSHEVLELAADPWCSVYVQADDGQLWAFEMCDMVQESYYVVMTGTFAKRAVAVSDFVLPQFFDADPGSIKWSWTGAAPGPFQLAPGGYAVVMKAGKERQIFAAQPPKSWRMASKLHPAARTFKRSKHLAAP